MKRYEELNIEIIKLSLDDVITTSGPFDSTDDKIEDWD